jgi:hypothetical protein
MTRQERNYKHNAGHSANAWKKLAVAAAIFAAFLAWGDSSWGNVKIVKYISPLQGAFDRTTTNTTYEDLGEDYKVIFNWDSTKYTSATVYFEAVLASNNASGTAYAKLQVQGGATEVNNSEVSVTGTTYTRVRSSAITLTDSTQYKVIIKSNNGSYTTKLRDSRLVIIQDTSSMSATETHVLLSPFYSTTTSSGSGNETTYDQRFYYDSSQWDGTVTVLFEATLRNQTAPKTATATLWDFTSGTAVAGTVNNTGLSMALATQSVTLTSGHYYGVKLKTTSGGTARMSSAKLIFQQSGAITKTQTHIPFIYDGTQATGSSYSDLSFPVQFDPANWSGVSNSYFHQVSSKPAGTDLTNIIFTELYNSTGSSSLDERRWGSPDGSSSSWTALGPSSPMAMPTSASTITTRLKHPGTTSGYTANRLIIQTCIGTTAKIVKEVHLQSGENLPASGTSWTTGPGITSIPFLWQPSNYTNPRVYFEAVLQTDNASNYASAALFKVGDTTPVAESQVFSNSTSYERLRSENLLSLEDGQEYFVQIKNSGGTTTSINTSRLIIYQESATIDKTESHAFLNGYDGPSSTSYTEGYYPIYYYYDSSQFDGTVTVYFEAYISSSTVGETVYAELFQVGGSAVSGSEISSASGDTERQRSGSITLTSGQTYGVKLKATNSTGFLYGAKLIIQQSGTGLTKTESYFQLAHNDNSNAGFTDTSYTAQNLFNLYEPNNWSWNIPTACHEATFKTSSSSKTGYVELYNNDDSSSISALTTTSTTYTRSRSASLTMPTTAKTMEMREKVTSGGTLDVSGNRFILQSTFYSATVVTLASFSARADAGRVTVEWTTKSEINNLGFNLYRSVNGGAEVKLNSTLIPGLISSVSGEQYTYSDTSAPAGTPVCYTLEDIDLKGTRTSHGPACVYWPAPQVIQENTQVSTGTKVEVETAEATLTGTGAAVAPGSSLNTLPSTLDTHPPVTRSRVTAVTVSSLAARTDGKGVLISWKTGHEVNNLGFHVYREESGHRIRLTREPLAGGALTVGNTHVDAGHSYSFTDTGARGMGHGSRYYVEDIDLNRTRTLHGPVSPTPSDTPLSAQQPAFLSQLNGHEGSADAALAARIGSATGTASTDRRTQPLPYELASPQETQRALAASSALKLYLREEGWYRVSLSDLGFTTGATRFLQLYVAGKEQPLAIKDGVVEFYGTGLDTPYTDTNVSWLVAATRPGKRIQKAEGGHAAGIQTSFAATVTLKERSIYFAGLRNGDAENFFGSVLADEPVEKQLMVTQSAAGGAVLDVTLQGVTTLAHEVLVSLNGAMLGTCSFSGQNQGHAAFTVPQGVREGMNTVTLHAGGNLDVSMVDTLKLTYPKTYTAEQDRLRFTAQGGKQVVVRGFSTNQVQIMDITDPNAVQEVMGEVRKDGAGYAIRVTVPGVQERTLLAVTAESALHPAAFVANEPSGWYASRGADLVMVSHHDFMGALTPLKHLREQEGLSVALIDIEDVYDEFSYGIKTPYALKDFMTRARSWSRPPRYVLLVGDASSDPKNYTGLGVLDLVPTKLVDATYLETASDDWFVDANGDLIPDSAIGRLPVRTPDEAALLVAKITHYATASPGRKALLVADEQSPEDLFDFTAASEAVRALLPSLATETFYRGTQDDGQLKTDLFAAFNQGPLLVNYVGHGSVEIWRGDIFTSPDAQALTNGPKLPIVVAMTCLNGLFQDIYTESLAEALLRAPNGGAVAVFASSGLTDPYPQSIMNQEFIRFLFAGAHPTLGDAVQHAKQATTDPDVRKTWVLLGDPAMRRP